MDVYNEKYLMRSNIFQIKKLIILSTHALCCPCLSLPEKRRRGREVGGERREERRIAAAAGGEGRRRRGREEKRSRRRESGEGKKEEKKEEEERTRECNPSGTGPGSEKVRAEPPGRTRRAEKPGLSKTALVRKMAGPPRPFFLVLAGLCWGG